MSDSPEFSALLVSFSLAFKQQGQDPRAIISRYALAACLLHETPYNLMPILETAFFRIEELGVDAYQAGLKAIQQIEAELKDTETYTRQLTNNVHALYSRAMSRLAFFRDTGNIIETQLTEAWKSGADEMMVLPEDMTEEDNAYIQKLIKDEKKYLDKFADDIQDAAAEGQGWQQFQPRVGMWVNRINDVENQARIYFGGKQRLIWKYGPTEHCDDCLRLNGIVAFAQEWKESGVHPQSRDLKCHGLKCQCTCTPTSKRRTVKALDRIKAIMGSGSSKSFPGHSGIPGHLGGSRPRGGSGLVAGKVTRIENSIRGSNVEVGVIIDSQSGDILFQGKGTAVQGPYMSDAELGKIKGNIDIHTHPSDMSFSAGDLRNYANHQPSEARIVAPHVTYILKPKTGNEWPSQRELGHSYSENFDKEYKKTRSYAVHSGDIDSPEMHEFSHKVTSGIAEELNLDYQRIKV